jgi:hypothetical protein
MSIFCQQTALVQRPAQFKKPRTWASLASHADNVSVADAAAHSLKPWALGGTTIAG